MSLPLMTSATFLVKASHPRGLYIAFITRATATICPTSDERRERTNEKKSTLEPRDNRKLYNEIPLKHIFPIMLHFPSNTFLLPTGAQRDGWEALLLLLHVSCFCFTLNRYVLCFIFLSTFLSSLFFLSMNFYIYFF